MTEQIVDLINQAPTKTMNKTNCVIAASLCSSQRHFQMSNVETRPLSHFSRNELLIIDHCFKVRIERTCIVTPIAIRIKMTLSRKMFTTKKTEYPIVNHKKERDKTFTFNGMPFFSR